MTNKPSPFSNGIDQADFPPQCFSDISAKGEPLHAVLWQGRQWAVTDYGIECRTGKYAIQSAEIQRIDTRDYLSSGSLSMLKTGWSWIQHMEEKEWVDIEDFENALLAFSLLFDVKGVRNSIQSPRIKSEFDAENYALQAGEQAYISAKQRIIE